jgi:hypothetical protein
MGMLVVEVAPQLGCELHGVPFSRRRAS